MIQHCINTPRHTSEPVASVQLKYSGLNPTSVERRFKASAVIFLKFILVDYKCIQRVLMLSNHKKRYLQTVFFFSFTVQICLGEIRDWKNWWMHSLIENLHLSLYAIIHLSFSIYIYDHFICVFVNISVFPPKYLLTNF